MENLKKNLHFVVFGGGVLLGILLLVGGIMFRSGVESDLEARQKELAALAPRVKSEGTLADVKDRSERFSGSLAEAQKALGRTEMMSFGTGYDTHASGGQFYSNEANRKITELSRRYKALEQPEIKLGSLLSRYRFEITGFGQSRTSIWEEFEKSMPVAQPEQIKDHQRTLRFLEEVLVIIERLVQQGLDGGLGVALTGLRTEGGWGPSRTNEADSPWMVMRFDLSIDSSAALIMQLAEELARPTSLTMEKVDGAANRMGFPVFVDSLQIEMLPRPEIVRYVISNVGNDRGGSASKAEVADKLNSSTEGEKIVLPSDPNSVSGSSGVGKTMVDRVKKRLEDEERTLLPVRSNLKVRAAAFNNKWRVVAAE